VKSFFSKAFAFFGEARKAWVALMPAAGMLATFLTTTSPSTTVIASSSGLTFLVPVLTWLTKNGKIQLFSVERAVAKLIKSGDYDKARRVADAIAAAMDKLQESQFPPAAPAPTPVAAPVEVPVEVPTPPVAQATPPIAPAAEVPDAAV
jgi:hypothetical protein